MLRLFAPLLLACLAVMPARGQAPVDLSFLATRAEASGFEETTRYDEVMAFIDVLASSSDQVHVTHFGYTYEGRPLPLVVVGEVPEPSAQAVHRSEQLRVLVVANIHAGEVAGKEAALMLLRKLAAGGYEAWSDSLTLLVAPIYNADGNERIRLDHRPHQLGPIGGMGQRPNAQGFDLNRDHLKLDSPEARSLVRLIDRFDPHVVLDLHTTNGTYHAYHLTYAPPLHPDTPAPIDSLLRQHWLPTVTQRLREQRGLLTWHYGNVPRGSDVERGWYTFDYRPRFNNNYVGLRGRFAILSEAYAYLPFEQRIRATLAFTEEVLHYAAEHAPTLRAGTAHADDVSPVGQQLTLRARHARSVASHDVLLGAVEPERHPLTGDTLMRRRNVVRPESMATFIAFESTVTRAAPRAYFVPADQHQVIDRLIAHGIHYEALAEPLEVQAEQYRIDTLTVADQRYQGHHAITLQGHYVPQRITLSEGTLRVPVDQRLGRLAFSLLEPEAADGLAAWGLISGLRGGAFYPIVRLPFENAAEEVQGAP